MTGGGGLSWEVARNFPERIHHLFILNCPPVEILFKGLFRVPHQIVQSYYIFFFQLPILPELVFLKFNLIKKMYEKISGPDGECLKDEEIRAYVKSFSVPRPMSGINLYRSAMRDMLRGQISFHPKKLSLPVKVIWGINDVALNIGLTLHLSEAVHQKYLKIHYVKGASHSVQQNNPYECAREILKELSD